MSCLTESNHGLQSSFAIGPRFESLIQVSKTAADQMLGIIIVVGTKLLPYILLIMDEGHSLAGERMQSDLRNIPGSKGLGIGLAGLRNVHLAGGEL